MKTFTKFLVLVFIGGLVVNFLPSAVSAEELGLIQKYAPCDGNTCGTCDVVKLANGLIMWLIGFIFLLFALLLMRAGVKLVMSGGNPGALQDAKDSFINALVGFIIILAAWLIVDTLMRGLVGQAGNEGELATKVVDGQRSGFLLWSEITCTKQEEANKCDENCQQKIKLEGIEVYDNGTILSENRMSTVGTVGGGESITPSGNLGTYAGRQFDTAIIPNVKYIAETYNLRVSGGYRDPVRNRQVGGVENSKHLTGRAADFVGTREQMEAGLAWSRANGGRGLIHDAGSGTHLHVEW